MNGKRILFILLLIVVLSLTYIASSAEIIPYKCANNIYKETIDPIFNRYENDRGIAYYYLRKIDSAYVQGDQIVCQYDKIVMSLTDKYLYVDFLTNIGLRKRK